MTTAVIHDACLKTRWHHGVYISPKEDRLEIVARSRSRRDKVRVSVGAMNAELSRADLLATVQSGRKQASSRVCTPGLIRIDRPTQHFNNYIRKNW